MGGGSKQLLTKGEQMRRAETTAFAGAGGAHGANAGSLESCPGQHIPWPRPFLRRVVTDDLRTIAGRRRLVDQS